MIPDIPAHAPFCAAPDPSPKAPRQILPDLACDSHVHICGPLSRYDYPAERIYTPPDSLLVDYMHLSKVLGLQRVIFIQPSIYGTDNSAMLDAMHECPIENRGVAVVDESVSDAELKKLDHIGIRGIRFNLIDIKNKTSQLPIEYIRRLAEKIHSLGWHVELLIHVDDYPDLERQLNTIPTDVVVSHLGYFRPHRNTNDKGFQGLLRLMQRGRVWTKLTGPYRVSTDPLPYPSVDIFAKHLVQEAPERIVWGSDWPHVMVKGNMPNDGDLLDLLFDWVPDATKREKILVDNAAELYNL